jgi:hypothetical protein
MFSPVISFETGKCESYYFVLQDYLIYSECFDFPVNLVNVKKKGRERERSKERGKEGRRDEGKERREEGGKEGKREREGGKGRKE